MKKKTFDCIEFQHQVGDKLMKRLQGMTREEQVEYWKQRMHALQHHQGYHRDLRKSE
jgi:hypothetical protein